MGSAGRPDRALAVWHHDECDDRNSTPAAPSLMGALACAFLASRYPEMAARREHTWVLAVTTSGRSSAILHNMKRPLCKGFDMVRARARDGYDPTRHDLSLLANGPYGPIQITKLILMGLLVIAVAALSYRQPPDPRARSNQ